MHDRKENCPARNKRCRKCNKMGHFEAVCKTKMLKQVRAEAATDSDEDSFFIGELFLRATAKSTVIEESDSDIDWDIELLMNGSPVNFKIDTGADTTVMTDATFNSLQQKPKLHKSRSTVYSPGGKVRCVGSFLATTTHNGQTYQYWITVIKGQFVSNLLGRAVAKQMKLVKRVNAISGDYLLSGHVFGEIGLLNCVPVKIELMEEAIPYSVNTPRRVPFSLLPKVEKELKRMLNLGIIEEVTEPTWLVPAPKRNKDEVRVCVDLKRLNKLVPLINSYDLDKSPLRCQRLLMRLMRFNVTAEHVPGKQLVVADTLSRHPLKDSYVLDTETQVKAYVNAMVASKPIRSPKLEEIRQATQKDAELQKVVMFIRKGWPRNMAGSSPTHGYYAVRGHLSELDGLVL
ncbi:uncharacterized protein LOC129353585 [Poeciliopsis prolifica]|uniref:uncharacterized protein LOC129353585 n=1 Tax=Poeciliopsis prolifica TaxID=188132 RepID=UPI002413F59F|nr:uncharacterized protein LOC129353585 [Poeciliopsis prolifica]XP_054878906.1 uncharacterized protein LOC129353585 [Poeciliopsis prolifica]XP_054878907.1 uncharacterized protein LOC129353585 [Poeciliopsis prolifica]